MKNYIENQNLYLTDRIFKHFMLFSPSHHYFTGDEWRKENIFAKYNKKGIGRLEGNNWSIRTHLQFLTNKEWNIIVVKMKETAQNGGYWGEWGILVINTKDKKKSFYTGYLDDLSEKLTEINRAGILTKYGIQQDDMKLWKSISRFSDSLWNITFITFTVEELIEKLDRGEEINQNFIELLYNNQERENNLDSSGWLDFIDRLEVNAKPYYLDLLCNPLKGINYYELSEQERKEVEDYLAKELLDQNQPQQGKYNNLESRVDEVNKKLVETNETIPSLKNIYFLQKYQQLVREIKELEPYLEHQDFLEWKNEINQLKEVNLGSKIGEKEKEILVGLVSKIIVNRKSISKMFKTRVEEKEEKRRKVEDDLKKTIEENNKNILGAEVQRRIFGKDFDKIFKEKLESFRITQDELTKARIDLETVEKILSEIESHKIELDDQLIVTQIEILPKN